MNPDPLAHDTIEPEYPRDTVWDVTREVFAGGVPLDMRNECLALIEQSRRECEARGLIETCTRDEMEAVARVLQLFTAPRRSYDGRLLAHCYLLSINRNPMSEVEIAGLCGVSKACVSAWVTKIRDTYGLRGRVGRSDEAREKFVELNIGKTKKRKEQQWQAGTAFGNGWRGRTPSNGMPRHFERDGSKSSKRATTRSAGRRQRREAR